MVQEGIQRYKETDHDQLYLVYPKNDNFKRHIPVQNSGGGKETEQIKLIPYSFSFCSQKRAKETTCA
jgi:hypothetical protein